MALFPSSRNHRSCLLIFLYIINKAGGESNKKYKLAVFFVKVDIFLLIA